MASFLLMQNSYQHFTDESKRFQKKSKHGEETSRKTPSILLDLFEWKTFECMFAYVLGVYHSGRN